MLKYNNNHIFTGYLKQLLSNFNLPTCKVYTKDFANYFDKYGKEDPRVLESISTLGKGCIAVQTNYIKDREIQHLYWDYSNNGDRKTCYWRKSSEAIFDPEVALPGVTKTLKSTGIEYDQATHEYLGDYLRFIRDYYDVNLMSMYNCFSNKICNNITCSIKSNITIDFNSYDPNFIIYVLPVKLFEKYTIAIDCHSGVEMFCGLYGKSLDTSNKAKSIITKTYLKLNNCSFRRPILYDKLSSDFWNFETDSANTLSALVDEKRTFATRWDIIAREKDLKLFIKVPASCRSSITILEGDYRGYNDYKYDFEQIGSGSLDGVWRYKANHTVVNLNNKVDDSETKFKPISKLQLLELNTGESYPFADRLIEYLSGNTITPLDNISDNIQRVQKIASNNQYYPKIKGLWDDKLQKLVYDQIVNGGPFEVVPLHKTAQATTSDNNTKINIKTLVDRVIIDGAVTKAFNKTNLILKQKPGQNSTTTLLIDRRQGLQPRNGHKTKSTLYDVLGYVDKDTEKWYSTWINANGKAVIKDTLQNVDIYNGLYDIE